jgi:hypothetical protein
MEHRLRFSFIYPDNPDQPTLSEVAHDAAEAIILHMYVGRLRIISENGAVLETHYHFTFEHEPEDPPDSYPI